jgi:class 3 adenylate cyclase/tetratricopeptide (TPR) repeat protein
MLCARCATPNPPQAKFCRACGIALTLACAACGHPNVGENRYCTECGVALGAGAAARGSPAAYTPRHLAERILASRSANEGEIKQVTVMFCDVCDSTSIAERLGPERMHELLERFFERTMAIVHRFEGTINQFLGDGFMALFGAPLALEDHARRALLAAVEIQRTLVDEALGFGIDIRVRIGLNSGSVVIGKIGDDLRTDYTAVGGVTHIAARLQQSAKPGEIVASSTTQRSAGHAVLFEPLAPVSIKGRTEPIECHRVLGPGPRRTAIRDHDRPLSPFVGRTGEMSAIGDALDHVEQGHGITIGVVGEPGIGKSRLVLELRRTLDPHRVTYLEDRCLPYSQSVPYALLLGLLRASCGIVDTDTPDEVADKVRSSLDQLSLLQDARVAALLMLLGVKVASDAMPAEMLKRVFFDTLRLMTLRSSRRRPILFVLEDLHWTDRASEEFFTELAESAAEAAVLIIATYRPGYSPPWMGRPNAMQIALRALSSDDGARVVIGTTALADAATVEAIVNRAGGNPFFLEELARAVEDAGVAGSRTIPDTIHDVIAARIDRLGDQPKRLLQIASVVGREFSTRLLDAVWDGPRPIHPWLRELTRTDFIYEQSLADGDTYVFRHALTHDVVYASMLERHRRAWHQTVGRALEEEYASRLSAVIEVLAHHFGLSDDIEKAVDYAIRAGESAQRRWANTEALAFFEAALAKLGGLPASPENALRRIDAVLNQAEARFALGQQADQLVALRALREDVEAVADPKRQAAWEYWVGFLHSFTGARPEVAIEHCQRAVAIARAHGVLDVEAHAQSCLAQVMLLTGDLRTGLATGEDAVASFESRGELWWAGRTLGHLSPIANALGEWDRALAYGRRALAHATTLDDRRLTIMALLRTASTLIQRGEPLEGLRLCDEATARAPGPYDAVTVRAIRGYGLVRAGRSAEGTSLLEGVVEWLDRSGLRYTHCQMALWLAEAHLGAGARDRARPLLTSTLACASDLGYRHLEGVAHRLLAEAAELNDDADRHLAAASKLLAMVDAQAELAKVKRLH